MELAMTLNPFRDEATRPALLERTRRHLEHEVGACQSSALVLTPERLPAQAAEYLSRAGAPGRPARPTPPVTDGCIRDG